MEIQTVIHNQASNKTDINLFVTDSPHFFVLKNHLHKSTKLLKAENFSVGQSRVM